MLILPYRSNIHIDVFGKKDIVLFDFARIEAAYRFFFNGIYESWGHVSLACVYRWQAGCTLS